MIRTIDRSNRDHYAASLDQLFRLRHACFVRERGWREFEKDGIYEQDAYDDDHTVYLAAVDDSDDVIGCIRLYPSARPHMLSEVFPHLISGELPRGPQVIEMSRMAIAEGRRGKQTYCELLIGMQEYGLRHGVTAITALIRHLRMPIVLATGYRLRELGPPTDVDGDPVIAVVFDVSETVLGKIRAYAGVRGAVLEGADVALDRQIA